MRITAVACLLVINLLFLYKYGARITPFAAPALIAYVLAWGAILRWGPRLPLKPWMLAVAIGWLGIVTLATHVYVPLAELNVDRWSVISSFLEALYAGDYPYAARSHLGNPPGPMPVYYLIAAPFHALGLLEVLSAAGYLLALIWLYRQGRGAGAGALLLLASPFMYWEIATRSNLFTFSLLTLWGLKRFVHRPDYVRAVVVGLLLSTRSVYALAYLIYYVTLLREGVPLRRVAGVTLVSALAFFLSFLPLVAGWPGAFREMNPFLVQGTFLVPPVVVALFFALALLAAYRARRTTAPWLSGVVLFVAILIYAGVVVADHGWEAAYLDSQIDISYLLFCVPFLGYYLFCDTAASAEATRPLP